MATVAVAAVAAVAAAAVVAAASFGRHGSNTLCFLDGFRWFSH